MSIFHRLMDILRAELNLGARSTPAGDEWARQRREHNSASNDPGRDREPALDPAQRRLMEAYAVLEIEPGTNIRDARRAWKTLLRKYHPDLFSRDTEKQRIAHDVTQQLNQAMADIENHLAADR